MTNVPENHTACTGAAARIAADPERYIRELAASIAVARANLSAATQAYDEVATVRSLASLPEVFAGAETDLDDALGLLSAELADEDTTRVTADVRRARDLLSEVRSTVAVIRRRLEVAGVLVTDGAPQ